MGKEEKNVHCLSSTECAQTVCMVMHFFLHVFDAFTSFCLYHMIIFMHICIHS